MKAWVKAATAIKQGAVKRGDHQQGMRYGKLAKLIASKRIVAFPSALFMGMAQAAGWVRKDHEVPANSMPFVMTEEAAA